MANALGVATTGIFNLAMVEAKKGDTYGSSKKVSLKGAFCIDTKVDSDGAKISNANIFIYDIFGETKEFNLNFKFGNQSNLNLLKMFADGYCIIL